MSVKGIAIIKYTPFKGNFNQHNENDKDVEYLVKLEGDKYAFFEHVFRAIGASFRFDEFIQKLKYNFGEEIDFESPSSPVKIKTITILTYDCKEKPGQIPDGFEWIKGSILYEDRNWADSQKDIFYSHFQKKSNIEPLKIKNKSFQASIEVLRKARDQKKLVIFVGAGVSINSGIPSWWSLISELRKLTDEGDDELGKEGLILPEIYYNDRGQKEYFEKIEEILLHGKATYNPINEIIFELNPLHVITTNYDDLLEQVINNRKNNFSIIKKDRDVPYSKSSNLLIKMHGDINEKNIVLKESDYLNYSANFPLIENLVKGIFASKTVLFLGFSFSDINLKFIIDRVKNILKEDFQNAYLYLDKDISFPKKNYLKTRGIQVITPDTEACDQIVDKSTIPESLESPQGKKLWQFLKFLTEYKPQSIDYSPKNVVSGMEFFLDRFNGLYAIPAKIVGKIFPFTSDEEDVNLFGKYSSGYHLEIINEDLLRFFKTISKFSSFDDLEEDKKSDELILFGLTPDKLKNVVKPFLTVLKRSGIICIKRINDYSKGNHNRFINLFPKNPLKCLCPICKWKRFEIKDLLNLNNISKQKLNAKELRKQAYVELHLDNPLEAYKLLEFADKKSIENEDYISSFICKYNIKQLFSFVNSLYVEREIDESYKDEILASIKKINLKTILHELNIDKKIKLILWELIDEKMLREALYKIEGYLSSLVELNKRYQNPRYWSSGANYLDSIFLEITAVTDFYNNNYLVSDIYGLYQSLIEKLWLSITTALTINSKEHRLESVYWGALVPVIRYLKPDQISKHLKQYDINHIPLNTENQLKVIEYADNFFSSNFDENNFMGMSYYKNAPFLSKINKLRFFNTDIRRWFSNFCIILSHLDLSNPDSRLQKLVLFQNTIRFVQFSDFFYPSEIKHFLELVKKQFHIEEELSNTLASNLLKMVLNHRDKNAFIENNFATIFNKVFPLYKTSDPKIYLLLTRLYDDKERRKNISYFEPFLKILSDDFKADFKTKLLHELDKDEDSNLKCYLDYLRLGLIPYDYMNNSYLKTFIQKTYQQIKALEKLPFSDEGDLSIQNNGPFGRMNYVSIHNDLFNLGFLRHIKQIPTELFEQIMKNDSSPSVFKWILAPEEFDYKKFDYRWFLFFAQDDDILNALKKNKKLILVLEKACLENPDNSKLTSAYFKLRGKI